MPTIDESVVKISLDDSQFDKASDKTIQKLDDLKESLHFDGTVESFREIEKAAKQTDFSPMEKGVQAVSNQFDALYTIADATLRRVINGGLDTVERTLKSLTIDNVTAGWSKYADKTSAVQTIMAATAKEFDDTGVQMEYVESQLEKLNWFTDETSYAFLDMVNNIGKFTSNQISLDDSVTAMQGIANWAAISGAGIQGASRAMYNLAQAIGVGSVKLIDWKSIENANMATAEFKEMALQAAAARGTIIELGDGIYQTLKGEEVTIASFSQNLSEGWFSSEVLMDTLSMYGKFADMLFELSEITDLSATPLIRYVNEYKKGTLNFQEALTATGLTAEELIDWLEKLGAEELDLGRRAFAAAQEAKTFQEAIDATKEAVASGWMQTFEYLFGNYEEAKELWSELAEGLYEVFVESANMRNGLLRDWKALGGRTYLIDGLRTLFSRLAAAVDFVKETFENIFPPKTAIQLVDMTEGFYKLMESLQPSENTVETLRNVLTLIFTILQKIGQVAIVVIAGLQPIWELIGQISGAIIGLIGDIAALLGFKIDDIFSADALTNLYYILYNISSVIATIVRTGIVILGSSLAGIVGFLNDIWTSYKANGGGLTGFIQAVATNFQALFNRLKNGQSIINVIFNGIINGIGLIIASIQNFFKHVASGESIFSGVFNVAKEVFEKIGDLIGGIFEAFTGAGNTDVNSNPIINFFKGVGEAVADSGLVDNLKAVATTVLAFIASIFGAVADLNTVTRNLQIAVGWFGEQITALWDWLTKELSGLSLRDVTDILLLMVIANFILTLSQLTKNLGIVVRSFSTIGNNISSLITSITDLISNRTGSPLVTVINSLAKLAANTKYLQIGAAVVMITNSLVELSQIPVDQLGIAVSTMITVISLMVVLEKALGNTIIRSAHGRIETAASNIFKLASTMFVLSSAMTLLSNSILIGAKISGTDINTANNAVLLAVIDMGVLMAEIAGLVYLIDKINPGKSFKKAAAGMTAMGLGILELSAAVLILSLLDSEKMLKASLAIAGLTVAMGVAAFAMGNVNVGSVVAAAGSMSLLAFAMLELTVPLFIIDQMMSQEGNNIANGLEAIKELILLMAIFSAAVGAVGTTGGAATLAAASAAMISLATAITILAGAMLIFEKVDVQAFNKGLTVLIITFAGFIGIIIAAQTAAVGLFALAAVFISVAASFSLFTLAIKTVADAAAEFAVIVALFIKLGSDLGDEFPAKLNEAMGHVEAVIRAFLRLIPNITADIAAAAYSIIIAIKYGFLKALPDILNAGLIIFTAILNLLAEMGPPFLKALENFILGLKDGIPGLLTAFAEFIEELFAGLGVVLHGALVGLIRAAFASVFGKGVGDLIGDYFHEAGGSTVRGYVEGAEDAVSDSRARLEKVGTDTNQGLRSGLKKDGKAMYDSGYESANATIEGMKDGAGTHSESWKTFEIGEWLGEGFFHSLKLDLPSYESSGFATMEKYMSGAINGAENGANAVEAMLDAFLRMVGAKTNAAKREMEELEAMRDEMELSPSKRKELEGQFNTTYATKQTVQETEKTVTSAFDSLESSVAKSSSSASKTVKTAAEKIIDSYKDALAELDYLGKKYKGEYDLWEILNIDATDMEKKTANLEYVNKEIETQIKRTQIAEEKYKKIAKAMGKTSSEARDAEVEWIEQQVSLAKLQNESVELQNTIIENAAKQLELDNKNAELSYNLWVSTNQNASKVEQQQKKLEYTMAKLEYTSTQVATATEKYNEALEKYGEEAVETKEALSELLQIQKDYADISNEVNEQQEAIVELQRQQAELALENKTLEYDIWLETNKQASKAEREAKKTEEIMNRYEAKMRELEEATEAYKKACEDFGEESVEAAEAYKTMLETQKESLSIYTELRDAEKDRLEYLTEELSFTLKNAELEDDLWTATNENVTESEKHARNVLMLSRKQVTAEQELIILEKKYAQLVAEEGVNGENARNAYADIFSKKIEIAGYVSDLKDKAMELLEIESKELDFEEKRLEISESIWQAANKNASESEKSAHEVEKINWQMVLAMKELNNLSEQYNRQIERYGQTSDEARSAWESYRNKQKEILELQNERKALELEIIENELEMISLVESRAKSEYDLWEALNQDATESEKKTKKLNYQMQTLEFATEKLRGASKKYNYALKMYGEEAKETQQLFNAMLDAQTQYANTYNELKSLQQEIITKNNDILEQLSYSEQLLDYGYNMWEKLYDDISDAQKIEAEIKKLGMQLTTQVARANYYGAEWKRAVAKYGENSSEAQEAYLAYVEALYKAVDLQSSLEQKEKDLVNKREEDAQKIKDVWDEITAKDLVGGTSIYDELVEMGLSEAEIEAYVREKAGVIEDTIDAEMDFSIDHMQSRAEDSLREWGMTWMDGVYTVADDVVTTAGDCMADMTDIIADGAEEGIELAAKAMEDIDQIVEEGGDEVVDTANTMMGGMVDAISSASTDVVNAMEGVINDVVSSQVKGTGGIFGKGYTIGDYLATGVGQGILSRRSYVVESMVRVVEDAIWAAKRAAEIRSPSRITMWMGTMLDAGFIEGIESKAGEMARTMASTVQNGINAMRKVVQTDNTLEFASRMIADGITGGLEGYSYNILGIGREVLDTLSSEYDEIVDDLMGENKCLFDALREYGFDETTHGIEFVVNLDAEEARTELENLFSAREADLEYYDDLLDMQARNAEKDQRDWAVKAEAQAINRELNRVLASIEGYEQAIEDLVNAGRSSSYEDSIAGKKTEYIQNIYSTKPLSALDIYRNTNSLLLKFSTLRR